jgi:hypothetical protein
MNPMDTDGPPMIFLETDNSQSAEFSVVKAFNVGRLAILVLRYTGGSKGKDHANGAEQGFPRWLTTHTWNRTRTVLMRISTYLVVWCCVSVAIILFTRVWYSAEDVARVIIGWGVIAAALAGLSCIRKL